MTQRAAKLTAVIMIGLSLSGCSTLANFGQSVWSGTTKVTQTAARSVTGFFRPAPRSDLGGEYLHAAADETLNQPLLARQIAMQPSYAAYETNYVPRDVALSTPKSRVKAVPKLRGRYQGYNSYEAAPAPQAPNDASVATAPAPQQDQTGALSYVKIGGGSRMSDWTSCESQVGGYFNMTETGYTVQPAFDSCMRGLGYMTEAEAEAKFAALEMSGQYAP